jgi:hypothetical protein
LSLDVSKLSERQHRSRFNDIAAHADKAMPMDGLLGYQFLKTRPTAINFRRRELLVWSESGG